MASRGDQPSAINISATELLRCRAERVVLQLDRVCVDPFDGVGAAGVQAANGCGTCFGRVGYPIAIKKVVGSRETNRVFVDTNGFSTRLNYFSV